MPKLIIILASYILGSIPFGYVIPYYIKKIDIRNFGSGNIGATNVFRVVGKGWGIFVFVLDFLKGFLPVFIASILVPQAPDYIFISIPILAVCGHNWSIFMKFKGGKGVATSLGGVSGLSLVFPDLGVILILAVFSWIAIFLIFKYVSFASILASFIFFVLSLFFSQPLGIKLISFLLFIFILVRHKSNMKRLLNRKENHF